MVAYACNDSRYGQAGGCSWNQRTPTGLDAGTLSPTSATSSSPPSKSDIAKAMGRTHQQREYGKRVAYRLLGVEVSCT